MSKREVESILNQLKQNDEWYYPIFYLWLSTGLRNSELIGLTWNAVDLDAGELKITKTLRRWMDSNTRREWSNTKNRKHRVVPLTDGVVEMLKQHQEQMKELNLYQPDGVIFLTKKSHQYLYDLLLERVWKRTLDACGIRYRKLYSQRHTFLSHMLASGNSPADVAAIGGHRLDELLKTYAKPTGRLKLVDW
jgi:integrase